MDHIDAMQNLREKVGLMSYAQLDPLVMYKKESFEKFQELLAGIINSTASYLMKLDFELIAQQNQTSPSFQSEEESGEKVIEILSSAAQNIPHTQAKTPIQQDNRAAIFENNDEFEIFEVDEKPMKVTIPEGKIRPNDLCHCGSGKKFKKCHGA